jgi:hypothetical protein
VERQSVKVNSATTAVARATMAPLSLSANSPAHAVDKAEARPLPYDVGLDNANTFVKGLILVAILAGMYAIGKRLGIID